MEKKYYRGIQEIFKNEIENPSDEFVKFFARQMQMTAKIIDEFRMHIKKSFKEIINDIAYEKITNIKNNLQNINDDENVEQVDESKEIVTTTARILYRKVDTCKFWSRA